MHNRHHFSSIEDIQHALHAQRYIAERGLAPTIFLALKMDRLLFLEGEARVGVTGAASHAFRASNVESVLSGKPLDQQTIAAAHLLSDLSASNEYRAHLCSVMAKRAITAAAERAMG